MKNNCEIAAGRTLCCDPFGGKEQCHYWTKHVRKSKQFSKVCYFHVAGGYCSGEAAIRAAIEAERDIEGRAFIDAMGEANTEKKE